MHIQEWKPINANHLRMCGARVREVMLCRQDIVYTLHAYVHWNRKVENNHKFRKFTGNPPADAFLIIWKLPEMRSACPTCVHALHQKANKIINWENKPFFHAVYRCIQPETELWRAYLLAGNGSSLDISHVCMFQRLSYICPIIYIVQNNRKQP